LGGRDRGSRRPVDHPDKQKEKKKKGDQETRGQKRLKKGVWSRLLKKFASGRQSTGPGGAEIGKEKKKKEAPGRQGKEKQGAVGKKGRGKTLKGITAGSARGGGKGGQRDTGVSWGTGKTRIVPGWERGGREPGNAIRGGSEKRKDQRSQVPRNAAKPA